MKKVFAIDVTLCNGCYCCQLACKDEHCGNDWTPYAKPQPETGHFWLKLDEYVRGTQPKVKITYVPVMCQHCDDAPCIEQCPIEGGIYKRDDGLVMIDPVKCTGCQLCVDACPYGAIYYNTDLKLAQKCTGCAHLIDEEESPIRVPRCSDVCPHEHIMFGEESDFSDFIAGAETLNPEYELSTNVYYKGLPKKFIAGTAYTPDDKEVAINANCTLTSGDDSWSTTTDEFGDFWFEGLDKGIYSLSIECGGKSYTQDNISTEEVDVNIGDVALS